METMFWVDYSSSLKILLFFSKISGFCYGNCDQFCDWWIRLRGHSMICCFNYLIAGV